MKEDSKNEQLLNIVLTEIAAPLAARNLDVDAVVEMTKAAVGRHLRRKGSSVRTVGRLLGKSERWVRTYTNTPIDPQDRNLLKAVLDTLMSVFPASLSVAEIHHALEMRGYRMTKEAARKILDVYADMHHIDRGGAGFQARRLVDHGSSWPTAEEVSRVEGSARIFGAAVMAAECGLGSSRFGTFEATVPSSQVDVFDSAVREAISKLVVEFCQAPQGAASVPDEWVLVRGEFSLCVAPPKNSTHGNNQIDTNEDLQNGRESED